LERCKNCFATGLVTTAIKQILQAGAVLFHVPVQGLEPGANLGNRPPTGVLETAPCPAQQGSQETRAGIFPQRRADGHAGLDEGVAALFGVNLALIVYHLKRRFQLPNGKFGASTIGSMVAATAGAGCASCGTLVLGSFLSSAGVLGMPLILPFDGQELLVISIALLLISIYGLVKSRQTAAVCAADAVNH
jgi:hypothetical protein